MRSDSLGLEDSGELDRLTPADDFVSSQHLRVSGQTREDTRSCAIAPMRRARRVRANRVRREGPVRAARRRVTISASGE
jgi:hypothetical protein